MVKEYLPIVVGLLRCENEVCLSLRQQHQSHANCWEFPGGKVQGGESLEQALQREFFEELGVTTDHWQPLIEIPWDYGTVAVRLHVYQTFDFDGIPYGKEGQHVRWFELAELHQLRFPAANQGILTVLALGDKYAISGEFTDAQDFSVKVKQLLNTGVQLIQLRAKGLQDEEVIELAQANLPMVHQAGAKLMLNGSPEILARSGADGIQLASNQLFEYTARPIAKDKLLGISTHNAEEIAQALTLEPDFLLLSPVLPTATHPDQDALGWEAFHQMVKQVPVPVFALGGMTRELLAHAKQQGAQGIAAIGEFWGKS
ncbi:MAG: Nudix family hydrolase [Thiotrichales bacterium]|nr:Nudix family hydrolase [Thiotrichales bacterium]